MNRIPMEAWIANLRSKRFKQGTGANCRLGIDGEKYYCCLGVANETAMEHGIPIQKQIHICDIMKYFGLENGVETFTYSSLHPLVREWLGVDSCNPTINTDIDAIQANDGLGWSFDQIADALEQRLNRECPKQEK